jgi:hypothetical protein
VLMTRVAAVIVVLLIALLTVTSCTGNGKTAPGSHSTSPASGRSKPAPTSPSPPLGQHGTQIPPPP